jgi:hypothetical protein
MSRHRESDRGGERERRSRRSGTPRARETSGHSSRSSSGSGSAASSTALAAVWGGRERLILALGLGGLLALWVILLLLRPGLPYRTHPLDHYSTDNPAHLGLGFRSAGVPLNREPGTKPVVHWLGLSETLALPTNGLRSIDLQFDVRPVGGELEETMTTAKVLRATLTDRERGLTLRTAAIRQVASEDLVELLLVDDEPQAKSSRGQAGEPGVPRWRLEVWTEANVSLSLRCLVSKPWEGPAPQAGGRLAVALPVDPNTTRWAYPVGRFTTTEAVPTLNRAQLIAGFWERGPVWVWVWTAVGILAVTGGLFLVPVGRDAWVGLGCGCSVALLVGGLTLLKTLATPPLRGVDEVGHTLSYLNWRADTEALKEADGFGRRSHYARTLWRPHQKLTAGDLGKPEDWFMAGAVTMDTRPQGRSALAARVWQASRWMMSGRSVAVQLWRLRLLGLVVAAVGMGLAAAWLGAPSGDDEGVPGLGWWLVLMPGLPLFLLGFSNYAMLLGIWACVAAGVARFINVGTPSPRDLGWLGLAYGLAWLTSVNAQMLIPIIGMTLLGWWLARERRGLDPATGQERGDGQYRLGWVAFAVGFTVPQMLATSEFNETVRAQVGTQLARVGWPMAVPVWCLIPLGALLAAGVETAIGQLGGRRSSSRKETSDRRWRWFAGVPLLLLVGLIYNASTSSPRTVSLHEAIPIWDYLPNQHRALPSTLLPRAAEINPPPLELCVSTFKALLGSWGPGDADFLVSRLFWQQNSFLDSLAPEWERQVLTTFFVLGLMLLLWRIGERGNRVRLIRLVAAGVGVAGAVVVLTFAARLSAATPTLHGRYLAGVYFVGLAVCFLGWKGMFVQWQTRRPLRLALWLAVPPLVLHGLGLAGTLSRFYGG